MPGPVTPLFLRLNQERMAAMAHIDLRDQPAIGCIFSRYEYRVYTRESTHVDIPPRPILCL